MVQIEDYSRAPRRDILCIDIKSFFSPQLNVSNVG